VGSLAIVFPEVLGTGYGWVQAAMTAAILTIPLWVILLLPFAKILATSLSVGSGGSGGIFGPGMVIGGFLGAAVWRLTQGMPAVPHSPAAFVVVAMIACFGSIAHAPLAVMLMVAEMTGTLEMLAPAMVAVGVATVVVGDETIYTNQLKNRAEAPAHRVQFGMPLLGSLPIAEAMRPAPLVIDQNATAQVALNQLLELRLPGGPVRDAEGVYRGWVEAETVAKADPLDHVGSLVQGRVSAVPHDATLAAVADVFATERVSWVSVLDSSRHVVGIVSTEDVVRAYRGALSSSLDSLSSIFPGSRFLEDEVTSGSPLVGRSISAEGWPPGAVVVAIQRGEQLIFPEPSTEIRQGDVLSVLVPESAEATLRVLLGHDVAVAENEDEQPMI